LATILGTQTMLQQTAARTADPALFAPPILVANADHADEVEAQLDEIGVRPGRLILEAEGRNTASAAALAALSASPDDVLLVMPSDHVISDPEAFREAVARALPVAEGGMLVTFGITPERPETGFGYIERGEELGPGIFRAASFVEKPDLAAAQAYVAMGRHDWNAGIFLFRGRAYLDALAATSPAILSAARSATDAEQRDGARTWPNPGALADAPALSIDHAVLEKWHQVAVAPVRMGWSDVGSWEALHQRGDKDGAGNMLSGDVVAIDSRDCLIRSEGPAVVAIGVENLVVVATEQAVLIVPREQAQRVREAVGALQRRERPKP
jgi:mannose-1-phosphate guanylyltransferase/mannose-1-phosphate guanylyltransferase/mannose-6-phosphate isomerase